MIYTYKHIIQGDSYIVEHSLFQKVLTLFSRLK